MGTIVPFVVHISPSTLIFMSVSDADSASHTELESLRKQKRERAAAKSIKWVPSPQQAREGLEWISANAVKSDETVECKKVSHHFMGSLSRCVHEACALMGGAD